MYGHVKTIKILHTQTLTNEFIFANSLKTQLQQKMLNLLTTQHYVLKTLLNCNMQSVHVHFHSSCFIWCEQVINGWSNTKSRYKYI